MAHLLVLGGAGHIGSTIARHFDNAGYRVSAVGLTAKPRPNLDGTSVKLIVGDDREPTNLKAWIKGADMVVDAATPYPLWLYDSKRSTVVGNALARTQKILDVVGQNGAAFVHISSFTTLPTQGGLKDQTAIALMRGSHVYFEVKEVVERAVLGALKGGLRGCVVNPSACFGPFDMKPAKLAFIPVLLNGDALGSVKHPINIVDVRDLAASVERMMELDYPSDQMPIVGHNISVDTLTERICELGGVSSPAYRVPMLLGTASSYWMETAFALLGKRPPLPSLPALLLAASYQMQPSSDQTSLGIPLRPLDETLRDAISWYRRIGRC